MVSVIRVAERAQDQITQGLANKLHLMGCLPSPRGTALATVIRWNRDCMDINLIVDGQRRESKTDERIIEVINRSGVKVPQVSYHPQLDPSQTSDTCMAQLSSERVRACGTHVAPG